MSDRNTTGLRPDNWRALVKTRGLSIKSEEGAGGSHGIGKAAPFAVTPLRTVFYWTHYKEDGRAVEWFQGKSVLMSHSSEEGETQGTGFYGFKDGCRELSGNSIPKDFRLLSDKGKPIEGTIVHILGFRADQDWRSRIAQSVIVNYFYAIATQKLDVLVEPDEHLEKQNLYGINAASLEQWFDYLQSNAEGDAEEELAEARIYWEILTNGIEVEKQDPDLGHCRLLIKVADDLPSEVGFVRNTGMLITTQQRNLIRFPGCRGFAALCVFEDSSGNELLRQMENPQHNQFEPDRLPPEQQKRARRALKRITDWIRAEVRRLAGLPEVGKKTVLSELAVYLPDYQPEEPFDDVLDGEGKDNQEPGFAERVKVRLKPVRHPVPPKLPLEDGPEVDGDGDDIGNEGGAGLGQQPADIPSNGGTGVGPGEGEGQGGTGGRGGSSKDRKLPIFGVRILPISGRENHYRLSFVADGDGCARLTLEEAGDSSALPRKDVRAASEDVSLDRVQLTRGLRTVIEITADGPIDNRAWRLSAVAEEDPS